MANSKSKKQAEEQPKDEKDLLNKKAHSKRTLDMLHKRVKMHTTQLDGGTIINPDKTETKFYGFKVLLKDKEAKFDMHKELADKYGMQVDSINLYIGAIENKIKEYKADITQEQERLKKLNVINIGKKLPTVKEEKEKSPKEKEEKKKIPQNTGNPGNKS